MLDNIVKNQRALLAELHARQMIVRDFVRGVARRYETGLYLFGRPGTAKTYTVRDVLKREIGAPFCYQRGHLTPVGLFDLIAEHPDEVIVLDDLGAIFKSDVALQILLSSLEHPASGDTTRTRIVKYKRKGDEQSVSFRGGIICISNRELHDEDMLGAFKSRVHTFNYDPSDAQIAALMLDIADHGRLSIERQEARDVAHFVIEELLKLHQRFDLRLFVDKAVHCYRQWKDGETESDWQSLVAASIEQHLSAVRHPVDPASRLDRKREEHAVIREILLEHDSREAKVLTWCRRTGKSARAFYRRLAEIR
jgi:hypothetical protein